jgi:hypothetical protein
MSREADKILEETLQLSPEARAAVAGRLITVNRRLYDAATMNETGSHERKYWWG